jgi:hypothetical protein
MSLKKNDKRYILSKLNKCKNRKDEVDLVKDCVEGPKIFVDFKSFQDAKKAAEKIPYLERKSTVSYIRATDEG